jgi:hypothetical protein
MEAQFKITMSNGPAVLNKFETLIGGVGHGILHLDR